MDNDSEKGGSGPLESALQEASGEAEGSHEAGGTGTPPLEAALEEASGGEEEDAGTEPGGAGDAAGAGTEQDLP